MKIITLLLAGLCTLTANAKEHLASPLNYSSEKPYSIISYDRGLDCEEQNTTEKMLNCMKIKLAEQQEISRRDKEQRERDQADCIKDLKQEAIHKKIETIFKDYTAQISNNGDFIIRHRDFNKICEINKVDLSTYDVAPKIKTLNQRYKITPFKERKTLPRLNSFKCLEINSDGKVIESTEEVYGLITATYNSALCID